MSQSSAVQDFVANVQAPEGAVASLAQEGQEGLDVLPVPTRKSERWKYSPITAMLAHPVALAPAPDGWPADVEPNPVPGLEAYRIVLVNGHVVPEACDLPVADGVVCMPWRHAVDEGHLANFDWSGYHLSLIHI